MRKGKKEEGREDRQAGTNIPLCARSTVPFHVQNPCRYPHLQVERTSSEMGCVALPRTLSQVGFDPICVISNSLEYAGNKEKGLFPSSYLSSLLFLPLRGKGFSQAGGCMIELFGGQRQDRITNWTVKLTETEESRTSHRFLCWGQAQW